LSLGGGEFREKVFDRRPIFFGSIGVLVFSERRRSMDACDLRNASNFFDLRPPYAKALLKTAKVAK